jgi:hypothetical protein
MGLGHAFLRDLIELKRSGALHGAKNIIEIGAQQIADSLITAPELPEAYELFDCRMPPVLEPVGENNFTNLAPDSLPFWTALGLKRTAIDIEGEALKLDLNRDQVSSSLRGAFDFIVNTGTTEHVANQANAFEIVHDLTRVGGLMYHEVPAGGMINHGFIAYQPKFFHYLSRFNNYELLFLKFTAWCSSPIPDYLQDKDHGGNSVVDCGLRVALRKKSRDSFVCPLDVRTSLIKRATARAASIFRR